MAEIEVAEKKCSGCEVCQLWCSFTFQGSFNPLKAYIYQEFFPGKDSKSPLRKTAINVAFVLIIASMVL